ncbi:MAG: hypothetical protein EOP46_03830 [Sphingobacteriaceae bacterium]|nr:MAG: hypothetical protein EOP46_03830 [Sphingobacteriaceae bacterium]
MSAYNEENTNNAKPNAYPVDDNNLTEENLKKTFLGGEMKDANDEGMEGNPAGGHTFGEDGSTQPGDDKNNPSQNAGYSNEYFRRTEPSEEHPENNNFKNEDQDGEPNYTSHRADNDSTPEHEERGND